MLRKATVGATRTVTDGSPSTHVFLHIPKTAGMTVRQMIERNYSRSDRYLIPLPPAAFERGAGTARDGLPGGPSRLAPSPDTEIQKLARLPEERKRELRIVYGHTVFGVHEVLPGPCAYVTMLREPVDRVVSTYYYLRRREDLWAHNAAMAMTLEEYAHGAMVQESDNMQTRILAGALGNPGRCTQKMLDQAKRNIDERFVAVGLTERFDETVLLWGKVLGWTRLHYVSKNVARGGRDSPSPEAIRAIQDANAFDAELFRFAATRLDEQLQNHPSIEQELARFRQRNLLFRRLYPADLKPFLRRMKRRVLR